MSESDQLYARAMRVTPGGVHSPVRAFQHVDSQPLFIDSADGATICDADGARYTDYCLAFGPLILGHRDPDVATAIHAAVDRGWSYGTAERWSLELAELITGHIDWVEQIRFVNSGTEAVMTALRLARAVTGRNRIVKFTGCYHGHSDAMLIAAGSGMAGQPASAGITAGTAADTLVLPLDDETQAEALFAQAGESIAAVIIEPLPANHGLLPQRTAFLHTLARLCKAHGALLIFDEVISGFRMGFGGCAEQFAITPDLVTWGKIIGGGLPVGALAGPRELMQRIAPAGDVYQAGTLSANPVAMRAGLATLQKLLDGKVYAHLETLGQRLDAGLAKLPEHNSAGVVRRASLFWLCFALHDIDQPSPATPAVVSSQHIERYPAIFQQLLATGIYLPPSPYEVAFLSAAHTIDDVDRLVSAIHNAQIA